MKKILLFIISIALLGVAEAKKPATPIHRVMSANIRITGLADDANTPNEWDNRKEYMIDVIRSYKPDVVMMQEVIYDSYAYCKKELKEYFAFGFEGPEMDPYTEGYHLIGKNVIFLRKLMVGGVAHSFGLHVARMAGMPRQVLESAEKTLASLEKGESKSVSVTRKAVKPHNVREGRVESDGSLQLSFFQLEDPLLSSLKEDLDSVDLNNLTPLQAFDILRNMKDKMGLN